MFRKGLFLAGMVLITISSAACGGEMPQTAATLVPVSTATFEPVPTHTPRATATARPTNTPVPTATAVPTETLQPTATNTPTVTPVPPEIGDTYFDKEQGIDVYFAGPEVGYVDEYSYIVERVRTGEESVICAPCYYGMMEADEKQGQNFIMQFLFGLSKWRANSELMLAHGLDTVSQEAFTAGVLEKGLPEGLVGPSHSDQDQYLMKSPIPANIDLTKLLLGIYGGDQVDRVKYDKESPLYMRGRFLNYLNFLQVGVDFLRIDGVDYMRGVIIINNTSRQIASNLQQNISVIPENDLLYHFTTLAEAGQLYTDIGALQSGKIPNNCHNDDPKSDDPGNGVCRKFSQDPRAISIFRNRIE